MPKVFLLALCAATLTLTACGEKQPAATSPNAPPTATMQPVSDLSGKALHDANCISCHDSAVYTRAERKVQDLAMLGAQVRRCNANLGTQLFDEDLDKIVVYLNDYFYKFPK